MAEPRLPCAAHRSRNRENRTCRGGAVERPGVPRLTRLPGPASDQAISSSTRTQYPSRKPIHPSTWLTHVLLKMREGVVLLSPRQCFQLCFPSFMGQTYYYCSLQAGIYLEAVRGVPAKTRSCGQGAVLSPLALHPPEGHQLAPPDWLSLKR